MNFWDAAGNVASGLVVMAFCMKDIIPLRLTALASKIAFLIYGIGLGLVPVGCCTRSCDVLDSDRPVEGWGDGWRQKANVWR